MTKNNPDVGRVSKPATSPQLIKLTRCYCGGEAEIVIGKFVQCTRCHLRTPEILPIGDHLNNLIDYWNNKPKPLCHSERSEESLMKGSK